MSECCGKKKKVLEDSRDVYSFGIVQLDPVMRTSRNQFVDNRITTSRYKWWSFFPVSLFELFHRISNLVYAVLSLLYLFTKGSTDFLATVCPLSFAILTAMVKDLVYDIYRHRQDNIVNNRLFGTIILNEDCTKSSLIEIKSAKIRVGDVVICQANCEFPCDMIILASSDPRRKVEVTTANLDGETSSKTCYALQTTQNHYLKTYRKFDSHTNATINSRNLEAMLLTVKCEPPNASLHKFEGSIISSVSSALRARQHESISIGNMVLRGSKLVNTDFMIGMSIYTGLDTKLSLNAKGAHQKYTAREARFNTILGSFLLAAIGIGIIMTVGAAVWAAKIGVFIPFMQGVKFTPWGFVQNVFSFSFITTHLLPISLIITIEYQQLIIANLIGNDAEMYEENQDKKTEAKTVHTADELGQIEFLFSDKTGTLTQNTMLLRVCATIPSNSVYRIDKSSVTRISEWRKSSITDKLRGEATNVGPEYTDISSQQSVSGQQPVEVMEAAQVPADLVKLILTSVLCHSVEAQKNNSHAKNPTSSSGNATYQQVYQGSSPDEKALVEGSAKVGFILKSTEVDIEHNVRILHVSERQIAKTGMRNISWSEKVYLIDVTLEFNPFRKRMTVMARHPDGTFHIHSKGAETSMLSAEISSSSSSRLRTAALERVNEFALSGLRTLVLSSRQLAEEEYLTLVDQWRAAIRLFGEQRSNAMDIVRKKIESDLEIVGVTGVEDRLQDGVEDCLCKLREAGIQVWILTGDKEETAITVSQASGHFSEEMSLIRLTGCNNFLTTARRILQHLEGLQTRHEHQDSRSEGQLSTSTIPFAAVPYGVTAEEVNEILEAAADGLVPELKSNNEADELTAIQAELTEFTTSVKHSACLPRRRPRRKNCPRPGASGEAIGLVVDGTSLTHALHPSLRTIFLDLCMNVTTVLCCRMTPLQKGSIVQLVHLGLAENDHYGGAPVTAAVGDGGNDVSMILQANVGIGIFGKEGQEAVRAADYAIAQFRFLERLLLVHGHWSYHRVSSTMLLFYEKGVLFVTVQLLLAFYSGFSAVSWFENIYYILYNLSMTGFCYMGLGIFEKVFTAQQLLDHPYLYQLIANQKNLRARYIIFHVMNGVWQGVIVYFTVALVLHGMEFHSSAIFFEPLNNGLPRAYDFTLVGASCYIYTVLIANMRLLTYLRDFNLAFVMLILSTLMFNLLFILVLQIVVDPANYHFHIYYKLGRSPQFWITLPLVTYTALLPTIIGRIISDSWLEKQLKLKTKTSCNPTGSS